jgi:alcohol dehydrogenase class IV
MNALTLPPALRFNQEAVPEAIETFGKAMGTNDPVGKAEQLAALGEFGRLRDLGVPEDELDEVAEAVAARPGAVANPRPASPAEIRVLLDEIY